MNTTYKRRDFEKDSATTKRSVYNVKVQVHHFRWAIEILYFASQWLHQSLKCKGYTETFCSADWPHHQASVAVQKDYTELYAILWTAADIQCLYKVSLSVVLAGILSEVLAGMQCVCFTSFLIDFLNAALLNPLGNIQVHIDFSFLSCACFHHGLGIEWFNNSYFNKYIPWFY